MLVVVSMVTAIAMSAACSNTPSPQTTPQVQPEAARPQRYPTTAPRREEPEIRVEAIAVPSVIVERTPIVGNVRFPSGVAQMRYEEPTPARFSRRGRGFPAGVADRSVASTAETAAGALPDTRAVSPDLFSSFDTIDFDDNAVNNDGFLFIPPDNHLAAGPNHVVVVVNSTIAVYSKAGAELLNTGLADFFTALSPLTKTFDPRVIYDQHAGRWVVITDELTDVAFGDPADVSTLLVAVSATSDPLGTWYQTAIDTKLTFFNSSLGQTVGHWMDYPTLAVDSAAVYVTGNNFSNFTTGAPNGGTRLWAINKGIGGGGFYEGGTAAVSLIDPFTAPGFFHTTHQPAHVFEPPGAGGADTFLVAYSGLTNDPSPPNDEALQVVRVTNAIGTPTISGDFVSLGNIETLNGFPPLPGAPQSGDPTLIATNDRRSLEAVVRGSNLYVTTTTAPPPGTQTTAHWARIDTSGGTFSLADQGSIGGEDIAPGTFTFFPSLAVNALGEMVVGFSASAPTIYPGSYFASRSPLDPAGTLSPSGQLRSGLASYVRTFGAITDRNRWGDYSKASVDPSNDCMWVFNQHAITQGTPTGMPPQTGRWGTAAGRVCVNKGISRDTFESANTCGWDAAVGGGGCP